MGVPPLAAPVPLGKALTKAESKDAKDTKDVKDEGQSFGGPFLSLMSLPSFASLS